MDLARLRDFVSSIQLASSVSNPAAKMHRLFQVLCRVAVRYVEHHMLAPQGGQKQTRVKMDTCLGALGFSSAGQCDDSQLQSQEGLGQPVAAGLVGSADQEGADTINDGLRAMNPILWMANGAELEDWLDNNEAMAGLLQESDFDFQS